MFVSPATSRHGVQSPLPNQIKWRARVACSHPTTNDSWQKVSPPYAQKRAILWQVDCGAAYIRREKQD